MAATLVTDWLAASVSHCSLGAAAVRLGVWFGPRWVQPSASLTTDYKHSQSVQTQYYSGTHHSHHRHHTSYSFSVTHSYSTAWPHTQTDWFHLGGGERGEVELVVKSARCQHRKLRCEGKLICKQTLSHSIVTYFLLILTNFSLLNDSFRYILYSFVFY